MHTKIILALPPFPKVQYHTFWKIMDYTHSTKLVTKISYHTKSVSKMLTFQDIAFNFD